MAALVVVHALGSGPNVLARRARSLGSAIAFIDRGRLRSKTSPGPPPLTAEGVIGAAWTLTPKGQDVERATRTRT